MKTRSRNTVRKNFLSLAEKDAVELSEITDFVKQNCNSLIPLEKPKNTAFRICGQDGTVYTGNEEQLEAWKDFYLPERMEMEVIGAIDYFPCDAFGLQLVLLFCEDGKIYAYEDEVLHLVAMNLGDLLQSGMVFPGIETFKLGECFEEPTEEEYSEMMESEEIKAIRESHQTFRETMELELLNTLNEIKQSRNDPLDVQKQKDSKDITSSTEKRVQEIKISCKGNVGNETVPRPCNAVTKWPFSNQDVMRFIPFKSEGGSHTLKNRRQIAL
ncbi:uncharacterized protein LOC130549748 [Triplophysa rosa]|uniref:uncharacterized protein LOC130549748 n=1 Tax=Triplophysa rosa TaxID=992332 RepID=UPI002545D938|nr:uncharacterized protein LOC130549748 [Triplophysa rosa]